MNRPYAEVIGDPIAHSKSPLIHEFWLEKLGIEADYRATHVMADDLARFIAERRGDDAWRGCNVTIPHKIAMLDLVDDPGAVRESIGAMNTIVRDAEGRVFGTNTDAAGFYAPLAEVDLAGAPVVVIGAGGAARAVLFALARAGVGPVTILNRSPLKGAALLARFGVPVFIKIDVEGYEDAVLRGLSRPVKALSFEFTTIMRDTAIACIERLALLGDYRYNFALGETQRLSFGNWLSDADMAKHLFNLPHEANSGDVYARLASDV